MLSNYILNIYVYANIPGLPAAFNGEVPFISEYQLMRRLVIGQIAENKVTVRGQPFFRWMPSPSVTKAQESLLKRKQENCESQGPRYKCYKMLFSGHGMGKVLINS